jgi:tetratricopeptide (TPR) repeat protein
MYLGTLAGPPPADYAVGSFDMDGGIPEDFTDVLIKLRHVLLVEGSKGGGCTRFAKFFATLGVNATVLGGAGEATGAGRPASLFEAAVAGGDALRGAARDAPIEKLIETAQSLALLGELEAAARAVELFVELHDDERLWFEKAQIELMGGKREAARESLRRAVAGDPPSPLAQNSLAALLGELGEHDEAVQLAEAAVAALPGDTIALKTAVTANVRAGRRERARALVADAKELPTGDRTRLEMLIEQTGEPPAVVHTFPEHARAAREAGAAAIDQGRLAEAERLLRRAVELDPFDAASVTELGVALSRAGREEDAIAAYDEGIERAWAGELLRFNRGNALLRLGRYDEARSELERCVALDVPGWHGPRVNLVAALCALGKKDEARRHVDELERAGIGSELLGPLREQVGP